MSTQATAVRPAIQRVRYTHEAMADLILGNPAIAQGEIADYFGYSEPWISVIINSDSFQAYLAQRREEIIDPVLRATIEENFKELVFKSASILRNKLDSNPSSEFALEVFKATTRAAGYGARPAVNVNVQQNNTTLVGLLTSLGVQTPPPAPKTVDILPQGA